MAGLQDCKHFEELTPLIAAFWRYRYPNIASTHKIEALPTLVLFKVQGRHGIPTIFGTTAHQLSPCAAPC